MTSPVVDRHRDPETGRRIVLVTAGVALANLVIFFVTLARKLEHFDDRTAGEVGGGMAGDLWFPLFVLGLAQTAVTGLLLSSWKPTRSIGVGLFAAAAVAAGVIVAFGFFLVLVIGS